MADYSALDQFTSVEELASRKTELENEMKRMVDAKGVQPFSPEEGEAFASAKEERDEIDRRIKEYEARTEIVSSLGTRDRNVEKLSFQTSRPGATRTADIFDMTTVNRSSEEAYKADLHDRAKRAIEVSHWPNPESADHVERLVDYSDPNGEIAERILRTSSPVYHRAFGKMLVGKTRTPEEERALATSTNYAVPSTVDPTLVLTSNGVINPVRQIARVITITGNTWSGVSTAGVSAAYAAESATVADGSPTLSQPAANVEKAHAFIKYPIEVGEDWGALQAEMARLFADAKDTLESSKFLRGLGHGSNEPEGLLVGTSTGTVQTATASVMGVADIYSTMAALAPRWRARAVFAGSLGAYQRIRQLDTSGGASLWVQLQFGEPANLVGRPAYEWTEYSSSVTTGGASVLTFGDFNEFTIVDRVGLNVEPIPHLMAGGTLPTGERGLYAYWRNTSDVRTAAAFKTLTIKS